MVVLKALNPETFIKAHIKTLETLTHGERTLLVVFIVPVLLGCLYATHRLFNLWRLVASGTRSPRPGFVKPGQEPAVTIWICCYNEADVIAATIHTACSVDWPKDRLEVAVLDDSNDETSSIVERTCAKWREKGVRAQRLTRPDRIGYKAGNLAYHHKTSLKTEFIAIFDSDHRAHPEFLRRTVPHFFYDNGEPNFEIGLVQCPWGYYNRHRSWLTECDALNLDAAFVVDQHVRAREFQFLSFNGTGGIWRKTAVDAGGGWAWDTITEDLDLSFRVYIAGYKFRFVPDVIQLLEIPASVSAFKSQKHRWTKGFSQVTKKSLMYFLSHPLLSRAIKLEAFMHLTTNIQYVVALWLVVWMPVLAYHELVITPVLVACLYPAGAWFLVAAAGCMGKHDDRGGFVARLRSLVWIAPSCALALGMSVAQTCAFIEGFVSGDATFVRTPKVGGGHYEGPTEEQKAAFLRKGSGLASHISLSFGEAANCVAKQFPGLAERLRALTSRNTVVFFLEVLVSVYLGTAASCLISRSMHHKRANHRYAHIPATLLALWGFLWITLSTAHRHFHFAAYSRCASPFCRSCNADKKKRGPNGAWITKRHSRSGDLDADEPDALDETIEAPLLARRALCGHARLFHYQDSLDPDFPGP